jgi:DNA-binding response OmpR family regulator
MASSPRDKVILVVDDDAYICEFLKTLLEKDGFEVATAFNGEWALRMVRSRKIDLILLDWMMPVLSGFEVLKSLQDGKLSSIPVIVITAKVSDEETVAKIKKEINVANFMTKPVDNAKLMQRVHEILGTVPEKGKKPSR